MYFHNINYRNDRPDSRTLLNRGFFLNGVPRLLPLCRPLGHKPVIDGYDAQYGDRDRARWVICDRCGIRPHPQGTLDADEWNLGQPYTGPFNPGQPMSPTVRKQLISRGLDAGIRLPGAWPAKPTGDLGAQLTIGRTHGTSVEVKVGSPASEQGLAAHISIAWLGALYVHSEDHGRWLQRRLNNTKWESRETGLRLSNGRLEWRVWAPRDHYSKSDPRWMRGSIHIDPRHYLYGPRTSERTEVGDRATATVQLPDGTAYPVQLRLERLVYGRKRQKKTIEYRVDWTTTGPGIEVRFDHTVQGCDVTVPAEAATDGDWPLVACTLISAWVTGRRRANGYRPDPAT